METFKNILVIRTDRIGDVVLTTPCFKAIKENYPEAKLSVLISPATKDILTQNDYLDEIIIDDRDNEHKGFGGFFKLVSEIRRRKFDCAIVYHTKKRSNSLVYFARIPFRLGYKNNKFGFLLNHPVNDLRHEGSMHEAEYCLNLLTRINIKPSNLEMSISLDDESEQWAEQYFESKELNGDGKVIAIHAGASDPSKMWAVEKFAELNDALIEQYSAKMIIIGDSKLKDISQNIVKLTHGTIFDLSGKMSLSQCISLLKRCDILISNDSGPVHLASALGTPVISIFTRNQPGINPERWAPLGPHSRFVSVEPDSEPSYQKSRILEPEISEKIPISSILEAVDSIFKL